MDSVIVLLQAVGEAPILKQQKVKVSTVEAFAKVADFVRRATKRDRVFLYLHQSFCPSLEETVGVLYKAFGSEGKLVVHYAVTPAWG